MSVASPEARAFYAAEALRGGWTLRQLDRQIQSQFYERTRKLLELARIPRGQAGGEE